MANPDQPSTSDEQEVGDKFRVRFRISDTAALARLLREHPIDIDHGAAHPKDGAIEVEAFVDLREIEALKRSGLRPEVQENLSAVGRERWKDIGRGDRFEGGKVAPRGLGKKPRKEG